MRYAERRFVVCLCRDGARRTVSGQIAHSKPHRSLANIMALPKDIKWVTFDVYGTLIDWESGVYEAFQTEAERTDFSSARQSLADRALQSAPGRHQVRLLRALRRGAAPHRPEDLRGTRMGSRAFAHELPARQRRALEAVPRGQRRARPDRQEVPNRPRRQHRRQAPGRQPPPHPQRLRHRRHRAAGPQLQARGRTLHRDRSSHRRQEGLDARRQFATTTTSARR